MGKRSTTRPGPEARTATGKSDLMCAAYRMTPARGYLPSVNRPHDTLGRDRLLREHHAERCERIVDGIEDRGGRAGRARFAGALEPAGDSRRRRLDVVGLDRRDVG